MKATVFNSKPSGPPAGLDSKKGPEPGAHIRTSRVPVLSLHYFTLPQFFPFVFSDADNTE